MCVWEGIKYVKRIRREAKKKTQPTRKNSDKHKT